MLTASEAMKEIKKCMKEYWNILCEKHGIYPMFDILTTNRYIETHIKDMLEIGHPDINMTSAMASAITNVSKLMEGGVYMMSNHVPKITSDGGFSYNTRVTAHVETIMMTILISEDDLTDMWEMLKISMKHEFGHCIVFNKSFKNCKTLEEFTVILERRGNPMIQQLAEFEKYKKTHTEEEWTRWYYTNITEEVEANLAGGVDVDTIINSDMRLRKNLDRKRYILPENV